ncbi:MAG: Gldg family protein [Arenimonas sp.]
MSMSKLPYFNYLALPLLAILTLAMLSVSSRLFKGFAFDLTENRLHSLSDGTLKIIKSVDKPITLKLYYSESAARDLPQFRVYSQRVSELLESISEKSNGKIVFRQIDPEPFSEAEDEAAANGLQNIPLGNSGTSFYFGLIATSDNKKTALMPFIDPGKEAFLEYDLAKLLSTLNAEKPPVLAVLSSLLTGPSVNAMTGQPNPGWVIDRKLSESYEIQRLQPDVGVIGNDVDVLMLVHPKNIPEPTLYAIDQFVLRGGHLLVFVDPNAESDSANAFLPDGTVTTSTSGLGPLFKAWGLEYDSRMVVLDSQNALQVGEANQVPQYHLEVLGLSKDYLNSKDIATADLEKLNFSSAGAISALEQSPLKLEALVQSSVNSQLLDSQIVKMAENTPESLRKNFKPTGEAYVLAARFSGNLKSAFAEKSAPHQIMTSKKPAQIIVVTDTDFLADRMWVVERNILGSSVLEDIADNGDFAINLVDNLAGDPNLISLRARTVSFRPFERLEKIQRSAELRYHDKESQLQADLEKLNTQLSQLQGSNASVNSKKMTVVQKADIAKYQKQKTEIRNELRQVQHQLNADIDNLIGRLKLINILLMPGLVAIFAFLWAFRGMLRRRTMANN